MNEYIFVALVTLGSFLIGFVVSCLMDRRR